MCASPGQEQESTAASETSQAQRSVRELATAGSDVQRVMLDLARARLLRLRELERTATRSSAVGTKAATARGQTAGKSPCLGVLCKEGQAAGPNETTFPWDTDKDFMQELPYVTIVYFTVLRICVCCNP